MRFDVERGHARGERRRDVARRACGTGSACRASRSDAQPVFSSLPGAVTPRVSVIIVNYRGADDTITCIEGLAELDWPREHLEVIVVENGSGDGSAERIRAAAPRRRV